MISRGRRMLNLHMQVARVARDRWEPFADTGCEAGPCVARLLFATACDNRISSSIKINCSPSERLESRGLFCARARSAAGAERS